MRKNERHTCREETYESSYFCLPYSGHAFCTPTIGPTSFSSSQTTSVAPISVRTERTPIPYRIMVPRPVTNLLGPGRAVSVERDVLGPLRVMASCLAMGEACGTAAAQVVRDKIAAAEVSVSRLRARLREVGAIVDRQALPVIPPRQDP